MAAKGTWTIVFEDKTIIKNPLEGIKVNFGKKINGVNGVVNKVNTNGEISSIAHMRLCTYSTLYAWQRTAA